MIRNIDKLTDKKFDLLIIGGGIYGAVFSWQASLAGLSVALIEQGDFCQSTSGNTQKIIHGGLRYLQNLDISRTRQSLRERRRLMWLAPHLVHPLPCLMPTVGHGIRGKESLMMGLRLYDIIGRDKNELPDRSKCIPASKILSVFEMSEFIPHLKQKKLNGAAYWYDCICFNTERLVLAFIKSAYIMGAVVANYVKAMKLQHNRDTTMIVTCHDEVGDQNIEITTNKVINCTGPWINKFLNNSKIKTSKPEIGLASGINIITDQIFPHHMAVGLRNVSDRKSTLYFVVPWGKKSIIGTEWFPFHDSPDNFKIMEQQCRRLIHSFNEAYPHAHLSMKDVFHVNGGLVPCEKPKINDDKVDISRHFQIYDHHKDGIEGLVSILGVKYTTAGDVAEKTLRYLFSSLKSKPTFSQPRLKGGEIDDFCAYKREMRLKWKSRLKENDIDHLVLNYGTELEKIIELGGSSFPDFSQKQNGFPDIIKGETLFAVREEMALSLSDVVLRRTGRGSMGPPFESDLTRISYLMGKELKWSEKRRKSEISKIKAVYPTFLHRNTTSKNSTNG